MFKFRKYVYTANVIQFPVRVRGVQLTLTDHIILLCHYLTATLLDSADIECRRVDFCSQINYFLSHFSHVLRVIKFKLLQNYCMHFMVAS